MPSIEQLEKLLAANPSDAFVLYGLAQEHAKRDDHARAIEYYDRCLHADPHTCYAYFFKARSYEATGRTDQAIRVLRQGIDAARAAGDGKAASEIASYLDELEP
jgi:tetratricopeptide (TPR) repeat protein